MPNFDTLAQGVEPVSGYEPILELGRGGMGTVSLARAVGAGGFERLVVIKRLNRELLGQEQAVQRFLGEARHAALIHHANVVGIHQVGRDEDGYFLVLDYVEGGSLDELVDRTALRGQRIPPPVALRIGLDALGGLSAAHRAEDPSGRPLHLLHRDVSLQNVLVGRDGVARLADFGIAKSTLASVSTDQKYIVGKLLYLPPEYLARKPVGPTLDIYALGVTLWMALAGTEPWPDADEAQLVAHICRDRIGHLSEAGVQIAPRIDALVAKACSPDPAGRYSSAREMADAIEDVGRETRWLASHAEVAAFVEALMGVDLQRRREKIAATLQSARGTDSAGLHRSSMPPAPKNGGRERRPVATTAGVELPRRRTSGSTWVLVVGVSAVAAAVGLLGVRAGKSRPAAPSVVSSATLEEVKPTASGGAAPSASSASSPQAAPTAGGAAAPFEQEAAARAGAVRPRAPLAPAQRVPSARREVEPGRVTRPTEGISTANPYR